MKRPFVFFNFSFPSHVKVCVICRPSQPNQNLYHWEFFLFQKFIQFSFKDIKDLHLKVHEFNVPVFHTPGKCWLYKYWPTVPLPLWFSMTCCSCWSRSSLSTPRCHHNCHHHQYNHLIYHFLDIVRFCHSLILLTMCT